MSLKYSEISEAISLQPLHLIDEISHRVVSEYTEAICATLLHGSIVRRRGLDGVSGSVSDPGQPPCHSKPTKIAGITSRSSGTE